MTIRTLDGQDRPRRVGRHGKAICESGELGIEGGVGLDLGDTDQLPFLLAAMEHGIGESSCERVLLTWMVGSE